MSSGMPDGQQASLFSMCESSNADGNPAVHAQSVAGSSSTDSVCMWNKVWYTFHSVDLSYSVHVGLTFE